jgi:hypothetical protein
LLPVRIPQDGSPLVGGEGREITRAPFLDFAEEEEEVEIKDALILFITTPKELNGRKREPSTLGQRSEVEVA